MQTAPVRQPRVRPASRRAGRATGTALGLIGAVVVGSLALLSPFAPSHLLPSRPSSQSAMAPAPPVEPTAPAPPPAVAAVESTQSKDQGAVSPIFQAGEVEAAFTDLPIPPEPAIEPPRRSALSGTLAVGLIRPPPAPGNALELARAGQFSPAPLAAPPPPQAAAPAVGAPPPPRPPLPLQTELIAPAQPAAGATRRPAAVPAGATIRSDESPAPQRRG